MIEETKNYVEANFEGAKVRYGDTDSVMVEFDTTGMAPEQALEHSWKLGEQAAKECTTLFKKPNDLELEKVYYPYFLYSKKRYAAKLWTKGKDGNMKMDYIDVKGLQVVRRDNTLHVREVCTELLDIILESNNPDGAIAVARQRAAELIGGEVPPEKLMLSQKLADSYKVKGNPVSISSERISEINQAHVQVVSKMRQREPGSEPQSGDRVQYVLTDTGNTKAKAFEKSEDPKYAKDNGVPLDYQYYLENKFMNPVCDLLEPLVENPKEEIFSSMLPKKRTKKVSGQSQVSDLFKKFEQNNSKTNE
jgi:DNA polymerase delta subunit 1